MIATLLFLGIIDKLGHNYLSKTLETINPRECFHGSNFFIFKCDEINLQGQIVVLTLENGNVSHLRKNSNSLTI